MNIDDLTIKQAKELAQMFSSATANTVADVASEMIGKYVLIRTYSAGVWAGHLGKKSGNEVILYEARRMWQWKAKEGISLSAVAVNGIDSGDSRIATPVPEVWMEAIEIIPFSDTAWKTVSGAKNAEAR